MTYMDWNEMRIDSVLPVYTEVVPLESDYRTNDYTVSVLYPEWSALTPAESKIAARYAERLCDSLLIDTHVGVTRGEGLLDISFIPVVQREGKYYRLLSGQVVINAVPHPNTRRISAVAPSKRYVHQSVLASGQWAKIQVQGDGMYRLTRSALKSMGFKNPDNVHLYGKGGHRLPEVMNIADFYDDLQEIPLYKVDPDTWLFWADGTVYWQGNKRIFNPYSSNSYYFLAETEQPMMLLQEEKNSDSFYTRTYKTYPAHTLYEKDEYAWFHGGRNLYDGTDYYNGNARTYKLQTPQTKGGELLTVSFTAANDVPTSLARSVNGNTLPSAQTLSSLSNYIYATQSETTTDVSSFAKGEEWTVRLTATSGNHARLDYLAMHYNRALDCTREPICFTANDVNAARFAITGPLASTKVLRLGVPGEHTALLATTPSEDKSGLYVVVPDASRRFVAFDASQVSTFAQPTFVSSIENQNLHALDSLDMVIIVPASGKLLGQAERLAEAHRQYDKMRVAVVRADQVYNEFSGGVPDATAYRMLMKMLYDRADGNPELMPRYLILFGDCAWDNRMLSSAWRTYSPNDYLLCFESENSFSDTKSYVMEDYFGLLDDGEGKTLTRDKTDLGIGRFPVTSAEEARGMVDKSITYISNQNAGSWKNIVAVLGDDGDNNLHLDYADDVAERIISKNPEIEVRKIMWDAFTRVSTISSNTYPEVNALVHNLMRDGAVMFNYTGHAATYCLSHEFVMQTSDFINSKTDHPGLWVTAACDVMPFDSQSENIGEQAVLNRNGGALAFLGTARTVYAYNNLQLNRMFTRYLFASDGQGRRYRLGDAIRLAKNALITDELETSNLENKFQYALLGDPALLIGAPTNRVVLDSINGQTPDAELLLSAGSLVRMVGHLEDAGGQQLTHFNGLLTARVYDNLETIVCNNNAGAKETFQFNNHEKILYATTDSVRNGLFSLQFVMPIDINYSDQTGRAVFYAINDSLQMDANGYSESFRVGGYGGNEDDKGPSIMAYLNDEDMTGTPVVNAEPYFVAHLNDESGISYNGNGLGHDLVLVVDGDAKKTYTLNDYYQPEFGDYTRGTVSFSIPALEPGEHSLTFRAWDVLNNTNTTSLDFVVDNRLKPSIMHLTASQNPAVTSTNFLLTYDRPGANCEFTFEVFDFMGRVVWSYNVVTSSPSGYLSVPWNLCNSSGGRLFAGIYLYRVTMRCGESKEVTKTQKIIVAGNK